ncbi:MAG: thermonuclease family protein [Moorea sp. SIO4A1]|nr:thermonuclease family protein [Moorena sp. SIO4A1]
MLTPPEKAQLLGIESRDHLRKVLEDGRMKVKVDAITTDRYGRTVAELWVNRGDDWSLVQSIQSSDGMVWGYEAYKSDCPNWDAIVSTQRRAQSARIGVWAGQSFPHGSGGKLTGVERSKKEIRWYPNLKFFSSPGMKFKSLTEGTRGRLA